MGRVDIADHYLRRLITQAESDAEAEAQAGDVAKAQAQIRQAQAQGRAWRDQVLAGRQA